jgi:anti-sigma-K factor RskA
VTCAEFKELAAALALDALDRDERALALAHLAEPITHEGCAAALARAEAAARLLSGAVTDRPPPDRVWRRIEARLSARAPRRRWATAAGWAVAAAACVVALLLAGRNARLRNELDAARGQTATAQGLAASSEDLARQCAAQLEAARKTSGVARDAVALLEQRGTRVVPFAPQGGFGGAAFAVVAPDRRRVILLSTALSPEAARDYQLWVIPPGPGAAPVPAGLIVAADGVALGDFQAGALARGAVALAVSAEPKGGSPTGTPTTVVLVAALTG